MAWATAKAALVSKLSTIAITSPVALTTSVVYQTPPAAISDAVAWVLFPPRIRPERMPGGWRENVYRYRARLFVQDPSADYAALIIENVVEATIDAFDSQLAQRVGGVQVINGPDVDEPGVIRSERGGSPLHYADCFFDIRLGEAKTFG